MDRRASAAVLRIPAKNGVGNLCPYQDSAMGEFSAALRNGAA